MNKPYKHNMDMYNYRQGRTKHISNQAAKITALSALAAFIVLLYLALTTL